MPYQLEPNVGCQHLVLLILRQGEWSTGWGVVEGSTSDVRGHWGWRHLWQCNWSIQWFMKSRTIDKILTHTNFLLFGSHFDTFSTLSQYLLYLSFWQKVSQQTIHPPLSMCMLSPIDSHSNKWWQMRGILEAKSNPMKYSANTHLTFHFHCAIFLPFPYSALVMREHSIRKSIKINIQYLPQAMLCTCIAIAEQCN